MEIINVHEAKTHFSKLPPGIRQFIKNRNNPVFVSAASVWEIATKFRLGKLPDATAVAKNIPEWIVRAGFEAMPVTVRQPLITILP